MKQIVQIVVVGVICCVGAWLFVHRALYTSTGAASDVATVTIADGATTQSIARQLAADQLIAHAWAFNLYMRLHGAGQTLKAGTYTIAPSLTIPDIVTLLSQGKSVRRDIAVTFPEGWTIAQMAQRLTQKGFDGAQFQKIAEAPDAQLRGAFAVLATLPQGMSLEGYLFPDTYNFLPETTPQEIVETLLANFEKKFTPAMRTHIAQYPYTLHQVVTLASIVEREVHKDTERPVVAGIFYNRLRAGMPLGSDATLDYIFGESKIKHSLEETQVDSPYNTYKHVGLPPGPIGNPGLSALRAAVYPAQTDYLYFLNNATTGKTVFSRTYDEHLANKSRNGL